MAVDLAGARAISSADPARGGKKVGVELGVERRGGLTLRKPTMACRPPMRPKSTPYWKGERIMTPQARKTFQWARHPSPFCVAVMVSCDKSGDVVPVATSRDVPVQT